MCSEKNVVLKPDQTGTLDPRKNRPAKKQALSKNRTSRSKNVSICLMLYER